MHDQKSTLEQTRLYMFEKWIRILEDGHSAASREPEQSLTDFRIDLLHTLQSVSTHSDLPSAWSSVYGSLIQGLVLLIVEMYSRFSGEPASDERLELARDFLQLTWLNLDSLKNGKVISELVHQSMTGLQYAKSACVNGTVTPHIIEDGI